MGYRVHNGAAHAGLIAVEAGGVDVPVAGFQSVGDDALSLVRRHLVHPEAQLRDGVAIVQGDLRDVHERHAATVGCSEGRAVAFCFVRLGAVDGQADFASAELPPQR